MSPSVTRATTPVASAHKGTATHTGLCAACGRRFTVDAAHGQRLAKHGFTRPYGEHLEEGRCDGAYRQPHERSPDVARECRALVTTYLAGHQGHLARLKGGEITSLREKVFNDRTGLYEMVERAFGEPHFARALAAAVLEVFGYVTQCKGELARLNGLLDDWKPRRLTPIVAPTPQPRRCVRCYQIKPRAELVPRPHGYGRSYICKNGCPLKESVTR